MNTEQKSSGKTIKKVWRALLYTILVLVLLPILISLLLLVPSVQTRLVQWATGVISEQLHAEISIRGIFLKPFKTLSIDGFLVKDTESDTLLYVGELDVNIASIELKQNAFELNSVSLDTAYFNLYRIERNDSINLDFIIDALSSGDTTTSDAPPFKLFCHEAKLDHLRFRYEDYKAEREVDGQIDFDHIYVSDFTGRFEDVFVNQATITAQVLGMNIHEKSGFVLEDLVGKALVSDTAISVQNLSIFAGNTKVFGDYAMHSSSWGAYADFLDSIKIDADLDTSNVDYHDVAFFSKNIDHMLTPMRFAGQAHGTIADLKAELNYLSFSHSGLLQGKVKIKGLPDIDNTFFDADFQRLYAKIGDAEALKFPTGDSLIQIELPETLDKFGYVDFTGNFVGFLTDFVAYGQARTALGTLQADVNVKSPNDTLTYSGKVSSKSFALGQLTEAEPTLKNVAFDLNLDGAGFDLKTMHVLADGEAQSIDLMGYTYRNVKIDGLLNEEIFEGNVNIADTNIGLTFNGMINFKDEMPQISCVSKVSNAKLDKINLVSTDTNSDLSAEFRLEMKGKSIETLHGELFVTDLEYSNRFRSIVIDTISLIDKLEGENHDIMVNSTIGSLHINGSTNLFDLPYAFVKVVKPYAPRLFANDILKGKDTTQVFDFELNIINNQAITGLISDDLSWADTLKLYGSVDAENADFRLNMLPTNWRYGSYTFENNVIKVQPKGNLLDVNFNATRLDANRTLFLEDFNVASQLSNDSLKSVITWFNSTQQADSGLVDLLVFRSDSFLLNAQLNALDIRIAGVNWKSNSKAHLHADSNFVAIEHLNLQSESGHITCDGQWSPITEEHLLFDVSNFDLSYISNFGITQNRFKGIFNGEVDMYQRNGSFVADGDVRIDSLIVDGFEIGTIEGSSAYKVNQKALGLNLDLSYRGDRNVHITGDFLPFAKKNQLLLNANFDDFRASVVEPFIDDYTSELAGTINGNIRITGMASEPKLNGMLDLKDFALKINYLNTKYSIPNGKIKIRPDFMGMDLVDIYDENKSRGTLNASVFHRNFSDFNYDVFLDVNYFMCLNTTLVQNEDYYGTAVVSGEVNIGGYIGQTNIDAQVKTEKGTIINIPLTDASSVGQAEYIRFVEPANKKKQINDVIAEDLDGLEMNFQLEVDNDAQVQIIFDEQVGDIIKASGNGDILMNIDNRGTFSMYGDYVISNGDYLFTLQNLINKRFSVQSGSRLIWSGSPYDAKMDLTAIYRVRANPSSLVAGVTDATGYDQRMPVDVYLYMTNTLSQPDISFDVNLPSLPESDIANQLLDPSTTTEQELTRQTFSLLVTNSFASRVNTSLAAGSPINNGYEVLSNQVSNLLSQYFDNVDVGVNYRPGDNINSNQTEVALSTDLFNDRVQVQVNGSVQGDNPNQTQTNQVAGEFNVEYKINKDGSLRARAFNEANNYNPTNVNQSPYTQGVGVFYRKEFNTLGEFFSSMFKSKPKQTPKKEEEEIIE